MDERRGAVGADQLDAAVEAQIAEQRREDAHVGEAESALGIEHDRRVRSRLRHAMSGNADTPRRRHDDGEERQRMDRRPLAHHRRVDAEEHQRDQRTIRRRG